MRKKYDDTKLKASALELRSQGYSYREIAKRLGCSVYKVHSLISDYESPKSRLKQAIELANKLEEISSRISTINTQISRLESSLSNIKQLESLTREVSEIREILNNHTTNISNIITRLDNTSFMIRCAFGNARIKVPCPLCGRWGYLEFDKRINKWVCSNCKQIPL